MMKELEAKLAAKDPEPMKWVRYERFYSYNWDQGFRRLILTIKTAVNRLQTFASFN